MDEYSTQLHGIFISCDTSSSGYLQLEEIKVLCSELQIDRYSDLLIQRLFEGQLSKKIDFNTFQQVFVEVLRFVQEQQPEEPSQVFEVTPKFITKNKKYGRRSKSEILSSPVGSSITSPQGSPKPSRIPRHVSRSNSAGDEFPAKKARKQQHDKDVETFEAEGQLSTPQASGSMHVGAEQLEKVWMKLGFSRNSAITIKEFEKFSQYIGDMDDEKLQSLFDKLDTDHDGHLTLQDFIGGHHRSSVPKHHSPHQDSSHTPPHTPSHTPSHTPYGSPRRRLTPRTTAASKQLFFPSPGSEKRNSSVLTNGGLNGIFSSIDPNETGFASADDIIGLWESLSIPEGAAILQDLGINPRVKVSLDQLTSLIDQAVSDAEIDVICQIALLTCEHEIQNRRMLFNKMRQERDKFQLDLREANARNAILAKEFDEQQVQTEKSTEAKLLSIEQKYQEQIAKLQQHLDAVIEQLAVETEKFESEMACVKEDDLKLKEQLTHFQKDVHKLEGEVSDLSDRLLQSDLDRRNLLKDLEDIEKIQKQQPQYDTEELENTMKVLQEKLNRLVDENKTLKDRVDELVGELEANKQQNMMRRPRRSLPSTTLSLIPVRDGTSLSEYITKRRASVTSITSNDVFEIDEDEQNFLNRQNTRRHLPSAPSLSFDEDNMSEAQSLSNSMKVTLLEKDEKEREHLFRLEIALLEEQHCHEKQELRQTFDAEKNRLCDKLEHQKQEALAQQQKELQTEFVLEKQDLLERCETEKNLIQHNMAGEISDVTNRLKEEHEKEVEEKMAELEEKYKEKIQDLLSQLENMQRYMESLERTQADLNLSLKEKHENEVQERVAELEEKIQDLMVQLENSRRDVESLEKTQDDLKLRFKIKEEKLQQSCDRQLEEKDEEMYLEIRQLEAQHALQIMDYEDMLNGGFDSLKGKLREDFLSLLKEKTERSIAAHDEEMSKEMQAFRIQLEDEHMAKIFELQQQQDNLEVDRMAMLEQLQHDIDGLDAQRHWQNDTDRIQAERVTMLERIQEEENESSAIFERHSDEIEKVKQDLFDKFDEERTALMHGYEDQIMELRKQLGDLRVCVDAERAQHKEQLAKQYDNIEYEISQKIRNTLRAELEEGFQSEKTKLEHKAKLLQDEISHLKSVITDKDKNIIELREKLSEVDSLRQQLEIRSEEFSEIRSQKEADVWISEKEHLQKFNCDMQGEIDKLKQCEIDKQSEIDKLVSERDSLKLCKIDMQSEIDALKQCKTNMQSEIDKLVSERDTLKQHVIDMQSEIDTLKQCKTNIQSEIDKLVSERDTLKQCKTNMQSEIDKLVSERDTLKQHVIDMQSEIDRLNSEKFTFKKSKIDMEREIDMLESEKCRFENSKIDMHREIDKLKTEKHTFEKSRIDMQNEIDKLESEKRTFEKSRIDMQSEIDKLESEKHRFEKSRIDMQSEIDKLESEKRRFEKSKIDMQSEIDRLMSEQKLLEEIKSELQQEISRLKSEKLQSASQEQLNLHAENDRLKNRLQQTLHQMEELSRNMEQKNWILKNQLCDFQKNQLELSELKEENMDLKLKIYSLEKQLNETGQSRHLKEKDKRGIVGDENTHRNRLLQEKTDKMLTVISALATSQSKYMREIEVWKENTKDLSQLENFTKHQMGLAKQQRQLMDLQVIAKELTTVVNRVLQDVEESHRKKIILLESERNRFKIELQSARNQFTESCEKISNIYEVCEEKTLMIKKLMVDNANQVKRIQTAEEKLMEVQRKYVEMSKSNDMLKRILKQAHEAFK